MIKLQTTPKQLTLSYRAAATLRQENVWWKLLEIKEGRDIVLLYKQDIIKIIMKELENE